MASRAVNKREQPAWSVVCSETGRSVRRFRVPWGWLYQVEMRVERDARVTTGWHPPVFVPDPREA